MPAFTYEAIDHAGKTVKGSLDADTPKAARALLKERKLTPVAVTEATAGQGQEQASRWSFSVSGGRPSMKPQELAVWTRQLASLVAAGLQVDRALQSLSEEADDPIVATLMADLIGQVKGGISLSNALRGYPRTFDHVYCSVVAAGESAGNLGVVLASLADDLESSQVLKSKIIGAALYPAIVSAIAVLIVVFLMVYVLPQVAGAFSSSKRALPVLTTIMLGLSSFLKAWWLALLAALTLALACAKLALRNEDTRAKAHAAALQLPLVGKLIRSYNAARFAGTLGMLATAGVPILNALAAAANTVGNLAMRRDIDQVTMMVREGAPIGLALAQKKSFPSIVATFARMGAETGAMGPMLSRVGAQLSAEVQRRAMHLASVLEPLLIVTMGGVVMLIVLAVLMPIIELNSFVK